MRSLGVIGGLGPGATSWLYLEIIRRCVEEGVCRYPEVHVYSVPLERRVEARFVAGHASAEDAETLVVHAARALRSLSEQGVGLVLMPCNTLHLYIDEIRDLVGSESAPLVDMTQLASAALPPASRTLVLATGTAAERRLYDRYRPESKVMLYPTDEQQRVVEQQIRACIAEPRIDPWPALQDVFGASGTSYDDILMACTDLCVSGMTGNRHAVGSLQTLAEHAVRFIVDLDEAQLPHAESARGSRW